MSKEQLNLSEAAAEILKTNLSTKGKGEEFGLGKKVDTKEQDIGNAGLDAYNINVPSATPPGQTPPVGSETMPKLAPQPGDTVSKANTKVNQLPKKGVNEDDEEVEDEDVVNEDIDALMAGENLSEDFKKKATAIFESAVKAKVTELSTQLEEQYTQQFQEAYEEMKEDFSTKVDEYLDYVTETWLLENKLAVETGLKTELAESFISSLKNVFEEHYINIPEEKVDVVEELASKVEALEKQVNEEMHKNIDLKKQLSEQKKIEAVTAVCEGLTLSQQEKIKSIAESVDYTSDDEFKSQMETIKESYFNKDSVKPAPKSSLEDSITLTEEVDETSRKVVDPIIAAYAQKITQTKLK